MNDAPLPDEVRDGLAELLDHEIPGTPSVSALKTLQEAVSPPISVGNRTVRSFSITDGDPMHGALRSDDHIGGYVVLFDAAPCPECNGTRREYSYKAHHNIAGSESLVCRSCDHEFHAKMW